MVYGKPQAAGFSVPGCCSGGSVERAWTAELELIPWRPFALASKTLQGIWVCLKIGEPQIEQIE